MRRGQIKLKKREMSGVCWAADFLICEKCY